MVVPRSAPFAKYSTATIVRPSCGVASTTSGCTLPCVVSSVPTGVTSTTCGGYGGGAQAVPWHVSPLPAHGAATDHSRHASASASAVQVSTHSPAQRVDAAGAHSCEQPSAARGLGASGTRKSAALSSVSTCVASRVMPTPGPTAGAGAPSPAKTSPAPNVP